MYCELLLSTNKLFNKYRGINPQPKAITIDRTSSCERRNNFVYYRNKWKEELTKCIKPADLILKIA